jgi:glycosyltransferase involved in cell wall biosynthesis
VRIVIDATVLCRRRHTKGGQQRYTRELLRHLDTVGWDDSYVVWFNFAHPANWPLYQQVQADLARTKLTYRSVVCRIPALLLNPLRVPVEVFTGPADVLHVPHTGCPSTWRAKRVVTIHDLVYYDHPECFSQNTEVWKRVARRIARRATLILTVSEYARGTIMERLGVRPERVRAIYHGVSPAFLRAIPGVSVEETLARFGIRRPYVLFVGTVQPNKNLPRLLEAFDLLRRSELRGWQLVLVGQRGWLTEPIFATVEARGLQRDVVWTDFVSDEALASLYRGAEVFVLPSLLEGFGIPAIEAMSCGTPVVASKTGSLPEIVGDAGVLVDPYSPEDIAQGISRAATNPSLRAQLIVRGRMRAEAFRWERTARETVAAYHDAARM